MIEQDAASNVNISNHLAKSGIDFANICGDKRSRIRYRDVQAISVVLSVNSTFKRSIFDDKQQFCTTASSELLHYLLTSF